MRFAANCLSASRITEAFDDDASGDRMEFKSIHEMVVGDVLAKGCVIGASHLLRGRDADSCSPCAAGMKQQRRAGRDADIADRQKHRARRLTVAVDAEAFAGRVIFLDHEQESPERRCIRRAVAHAER